MKEKIEKGIEESGSTKILGDITKKEFTEFCKSASPCVCDFFNGKKHFIDLEAMKRIDSNFDKCEFSEEDKDLYGHFLLSINMSYINMPREIVLGDSEIIKAGREVILKSIKRQQDWGIWRNFAISSMVGSYGFKFKEIESIISRSKDLDEKERENILIDCAYGFKIRKMDEEVEKVLAVCKSVNAREKVDEKIAKEVAEEKELLMRSEKRGIEIHVIGIVMNSQVNELSEKICEYGNGLLSYDNKDSRQLFIEFAKRVGERGEPEYLRFVGEEKQKEIRKMEVLCWKFIYDQWISKNIDCGFGTDTEMTESLHMFLKHDNFAIADGYRQKLKNYYNSLEINKKSDDKWYKP